MIYIVPVS